MAKDFTQINTGSNYFETELKKSAGRKNNQPEASEAEKLERAESLKTQGRKGCKAIRINMAFTPSNYKYIQTMSKIHGMSMTEYVNFMIKRYMKDHDQDYKTIQELVSKLETFEDEEE